MEMSCLESVEGPLRREVLSEVGYREGELSLDVAKLKKWALQRCLPSCLSHEPDCFFETFLVGRKQNFEKAKNTLENYCLYRTKMPQIYGNLDPLDGSIVSSVEWLFVLSNPLKDLVEDDLETCCRRLGTMPKASRHGHRLSVAQVTRRQGFDLLTLIRRFLLVVELRARAEGAYLGEWCVFDGGPGAGILRPSSPALLRDFINIIRYMLPARIKTIVFINAPWFLEIFLNKFVKPFLSKKIAERVFVHSKGGNILLKYFPKDMLPKEYGGDLNELKFYSDLWLVEAGSRREWFTKSLAGEPDVRESMDERVESSSIHPN